MKRLFTIIMLIAMSSVTSNAQQLNTAEYFFNSDPGVGNGTALNITSSDTVVFSGLIAPSGLSDGFHMLYIRARDVNGVWSLTERRVFFVQTQYTTTALSAAEYFFDNDPGVGNGSNINLTSSDTIIYSGVVPVGSLTPGFHHLYLRSKSMDNKWSLTERRMFYVENPYVAPALVNAEYFVDSDPGFGNATAISVTPGDTIDFAGLLSISNTDTGTHVLYLRTLDASNVWSLYEPFEFQISFSAAVDDPSAPPVTMLMQNYPNPFPGVTQVDFYLNHSGETRFYITDMVGKIIYTEIFSNLPQGQHSFRVDLGNLQSGNYLCKMVTGNYTQTKKMVLLKQ